MKRSEGTTASKPGAGLEKLAHIVNGTPRKQPDPRARKYDRGVIPIGNAGGLHRKGER